ncbi:MAG TPA: hypothetical protein VN131_04155 [Mobilitalea sp.]|nr:hypothetical protein [Mobilitalea sp.]
MLVSIFEIKDNESGIDAAYREMYEKTFAVKIILISNPYCFY